MSVRITETADTLETVRCPAQDPALALRTASMMTAMNLRVCHEGQQFLRITKINMNSIEKADGLVIKVLCCLMQEHRCL